MENTVQSIHQDLIDRCKNGDRSAHYSLYKLYSKSMYNVAWRITGRVDEAEDALQEAFISAFKNLDKYRAEASFGSWLKRIVVNKAINLLKARKADPWPEHENIDVAEEFVTEEIDKLTVERVRKAIDQLPDGYRSVLSLYLLEGYDHEEIGQILGVSESTSKSQLNRAKNKLREFLNRAI